MLSKNKISASVPSGEKDEILTKIAEIRSKLSFLMNLTKDERSQLRKMGNKNNAYVVDCLRAGQAFPEILPSTINIPELQKDLDLATSLNEMAVPLRSLLEGIEDTIMAAGSDAIMTADQIYAYLKQGAKENNNIKAQLQMVSSHFKKVKTKIEE